MMKRSNLRTRIEREIFLWSLFALDALSEQRHHLSPLLIGSSLPTQNTSAPHDLLRSVSDIRSQLSVQLDAWRQDSGIARLIFSRVKNKQHLEKLWEEEELWSESKSRLEEFYVYQSAIDMLISNSSLRWRITRMGSVDRAILRMGTYELCFRRDRDPRWVLNEAVELGKHYGSVDSGRFINGVLDRIAQDLGRIKKRARRAHPQALPMVKVARRNS